MKINRGFVTKNGKRMNFPFELFFDSKNSQLV